MSKPCPICTERHTKRIWGKDNRSLFKCPACGSAFVLPRSSLEEQLEVVGKAAARRLPHEQDEEVIANIGKHNVEILDFLARQSCSGKLLEVGCGRGILLADARRRGWEVKGIEPALCTAEEGIRKRGLGIYIGVLNEAPLRESSFDAIIFCHSLEHVLDPLKDLQSAARLLKVGGWVYIETPNWASLTRRLLGRRWWIVDLDNHLYYFSPSSLKLICQRAGLRFRFGHGSSFNAVAVAIRLMHFRDDSYNDLSKITECHMRMSNIRGGWGLSRCLDSLGRMALRRSYLNDYLSFWFQKQGFSPPDNASHG